MVKNDTTKEHSKRLIMDELLQCSVCYSEYDTESHKPCIGKCGHSICFICASDYRCEDCPVCRRAGSFIEFIVSFAMINIIEYKNKKKQEMSGMCSLCEKESKQLAICIDCSLKDGILRKDDSERHNDNIQLQWNTENRSLDDCIKKARLSSFCGDCSIESIHCEHRIGAFKKIQQTIFAKGMSGIKEEIEGFLNSFVQMKDKVIPKLDEYLTNISSLLDYVAQLTFDQYSSFPRRVLEFIKKSKILSKGITSCHLNITNSINKIEKKLETHVQSDCNVVRKNIIHHLKYNYDKLEIYAYNTIQNMMIIETLISRPNGSTSIEHNNQLYFIGGDDGRNAQKTVEAYNLKDKSRRKLADMHEARWKSSVCIHNGKIVVCGGENRGILVNSIEEYDFEKNEWKIIPISTCHSIYYRIVSHDNSLYALGNLSNKYLSIKKFNKENFSFEEVYRSNITMRFHHCTSFNGKMFIIGESCQSENVFKYYHYNPCTNELIESDRGLFNKEWDVKLYSLNNQLYVIDSNSVEKLDEKNNSWIFLCRKK